MKRIAVLAAWAALSALPAFAPQPAWAAEFTKATDCMVGKRVVNRDGQAGTVASVDGSSCRVKLDSTGKLDYNIFWMLRPEAPAGQAAKSTDTAALPAGRYKCYQLAGGQLNYAFIDIQIDSGNRYKDGSGKPGTYKVRENGAIAFTGPLAPASAKLLPGGRIGLNMNGGNFYNTTCNR